MAASHVTHIAVHLLWVPDLDWLLWGPDLEWHELIIYIILLLLIIIVLYYIISLVDACTAHLILWSLCSSRLQSRFVSQNSVSSFSLPMLAITSQCTAVAGCSILGF